MYVRPTFTDVLKARKRIAPFLRRTPLLQYPGLSEVLGFDTYVKHENMQPTGAFKIRGGINLVSQLSPEERERGVITASTGNHGQSIALASKMFGVKATVCVQENANPDKVDAIRSFGAEIIAKGNDFDEARLNAERISEEGGVRYIHSANEPLLIAGVATTGLEILEDLPDVEAVIVPVGGGSQAAGLGVVFKTVAPGVDVIAVQAENAPSVYLSWKSGKIESTDTANTIADGLATRQAFELTTSMLRDLVDDFVLVSEEEIRDAIRLYVEKTHTIAEGAGAAPLAAAYKIRDRLKGKKVVLILSGGNLTADTLRSIL
jgi:threonine dehydratase